MPGEAMRLDRQMLRRSFRYSRNKVGQAPGLAIVSRIELVRKYLIKNETIPFADGERLRGSVSSVTSKAQHSLHLVFRSQSRRLLDVPSI
jgi:hypothetical protein